MKINRRGASSNRGTSQVSIEKYSTYIDINNKTIVLNESRVPDFTSDSEHNYIIEISFSEIRNILRLLGGDFSEQNAVLISEEFSPCLKEIMRIEKACIATI